MKKLFVLLVLSLVWLMLVVSCKPPVTTNTVTTAPAPGTLDTSFGNGGIVITDYVHNDYSMYNEIYAIAIQSDGKIIVAGYIDLSSSTGKDFAVARYLPNGTLDASFGTNGIVCTDFDNGEDEAMAIALQDDGNIVIAGTSRKSDNKSVFALARYSANGTLDTSFGTNGKVTTDINNTGESYAYALTIQGDRKILVAGSTTESSTSKFVVVRYNTNGTLDTSFDGDGIVITVVESGFNSWASAITLDASGNILVAGSVGGSSGSRFALVKYNPDGNLVTSFGTGGKVTTSFESSSATAYTIAIQPDGTIILGGTTANSSLGTYSFSLARYDSSGTLDTSFGNNGKVETEMSKSSEGARLYALKIQHDGKLVTGGTCNNNSKFHFAIVRYTPQGALDTSFGTNGKVLVLSGNKSQLNALAIQSDGKIVGGGFNEDEETGTTNFALLRLWP